MAARVVNVLPDGLLRIEGARETKVNNETQFLVVAGLIRSRDVAAKDTRQAKVDPSRLRLMERWLGQMKEKGFDLKAYQESVVPRESGLRGCAPRSQTGLHRFLPAVQNPGR